jgi:hypothetical protein
MPQLYTPPLWQNRGRIRGSLTYRIPTSTTTFKLGGVWHNVQSPGVGVTDGATYVFSTPTVVSDALAAEIAASGVGGTFS